MAIPMASSKSAVLPPVLEVTMDTPTYLEVPDFQRVAIMGDYASGVTIYNNTQNSLKTDECHDHNFSDFSSLLLCQSTHRLVQVSQVKTSTTAWGLVLREAVTLNFTDLRSFRVNGLLLAQAQDWRSSESRQGFRF